MKEKKVYRGSLIIEGVVAEKLLCLAESAEAARREFKKRAKEKYHIRRADIVLHRGKQLSNT